MFAKRYFQNDWSHVSQEEALRDIQYLLKNYKRYKISILGDRHVLIGNVDIRKEEKTILNNKFTVYTINKRSFTVDCEVGFYLSRLIYLCEQEKSEKTFTEKVQSFWGKIGHDTAFVTTVIGIAVLCATAIYITDKIKIDQQEQQKKFEKMMDKKIHEAIEKQNAIKQDTLIKQR